MAPKTKAKPKTRAATSKPAAAKIDKRTKEYRAKAKKKAAR